MRTDRRGLIRQGIGAALALALSDTIQSDVSANGDIVPGPPPVNPTSLSECVPYLDWDPAQRGTLLIVAPELARLQGMQRVRNPETRKVEMRPPSDREPVQAGSKGFHLATVSPRYSRKLIPVGTLSAVVPETMTVLRYKNLPAPDLIQGIQPESRAQLLLATLSPAQWNRLMSSEGLGMGDLKREQQALFTTLFPENMQILRTMPTSDTSVLKPEQVPLTGITSTDMRLRLYQDLTWTFLFKDRKRGTIAFGDNRWGGATEPEYSVSFPPEPPGGLTLEERQQYLGIPFAFGVRLVDLKPNYAKPSDIDYEMVTWDVPISLDGAKTVGDIVTRVREATRVEIYADKRYAEHSVHIRILENHAVRAGDILKALALSVTGTYRKVTSGSETAYVMTYDRVGLGVQMTAIGRWKQNARHQLRDSRKSLVAGAKQAEIYKNSPWALNENMAPSETLAQKLASLKPDRKIEGGPTLMTPVTDLPPGIQARIQAQQKSWRQAILVNNDASHAPLREDSVEVGTTVKLAIVVPGIGSVSFPTDNLQILNFPEKDSAYTDMLWQRSRMAPPDMEATLPVSIGARQFDKRLLSITVTSVADARKVVQLAQAHQFTGIVLPVGDETPDTIAQWLATIRKVAPNMPVFLQVALLRKSVVKDTETETPKINGLLDRNIMGETYTDLRKYPIMSPDNEAPFLLPEDDGKGEYIAIGEKSALQEVQTRLRSLVKVVPGTDTIVFTDTAPPGYDGSSHYVDDSTYRELGYVPALRLGFLRSEGIDPIDFSFVGSVGIYYGPPGIHEQIASIILPFFADDGVYGSSGIFSQVVGITSGMPMVFAKWYEFRNKQLAAALEELRQTLATENPKLRLVVRGTGVWEGLVPWEPLPAKTATPQKSTPHYLNPDWIPYTFHKNAPPGTPPMKSSERFARQVARSFAWTKTPPTTLPGKQSLENKRFVFLLDLTQASITEAEELLSEIVFEV